MIGPGRMPFASRCVLREDFYSLALVQGNGGVVVNATVDRGIRPNTAGAIVTYGGTQSLLINSARMTIRARFRTASVQNVTARQLLNRFGGGDNQFLFQLNANHTPIFAISNAPGDASNYFNFTAAIPAGTLTVVHAVYDGTLAAASRGVCYRDGLAAGTSISGTLPVTMRASANPLRVFNLSGGVAAPDSDFTLYDFAIFGSAMSATEVADDYADLTYREVVP